MLFLLIYLLIGMLTMSYIITVHPPVWCWTDMGDYFWFIGGTLLWPIIWIVIGYQVLLEFLNR